MGTELTISNNALTGVLANNSLVDVLKPLTQEIYLYDTVVSGTTHLEDSSVLEQISVEDKLRLQREDNKFDENAVLVLTEKGEKLGYIPAKDNVVFSRLMDHGKLLTAKITDIKTKHSYTQVNIAIYLVDF